MRPAGAERGGQRVGEVETDVGERRVALRLHLARGRNGEREGADGCVEGAGRGRIEVVQPRHALDTLALEEQLEFLRRLVVLVATGDVERRGRPAVEIDQRLGLTLTVGRDRLERQHVVDFPGRRQRRTARLDVVVAAHAPGRVVHVGGHDIRSREARPRGFAMTVLGVRVVVDVVTGEPEAERVAGVPLGAHAKGVHILVVVLLPGEQVLAVAVAAVHGGARADCEGLADRRRARGDQVGLVVRAEVGAHVEPRLLAERLRDVLDRAADGVAPVERALRPAQHLETLDVVDVEHRALRPRDVDVVHVQAHSGLEAPQRVLLPDAADERDERRVRAARDLQREVGRGLLQPGDVERAGVVEALRRERGHGDRHVLQALVAAPGGDGDLLDTGGPVLAGRRRILGEHGRDGKQRGDGGRAGAGRWQIRLFHGSPWTRPPGAQFNDR